MEPQQFETGTLVKGRYKTGVYIGEITGAKRGNYVVKVLAVVTHPTQGDLHHPNEANVAFFQERKALAYCEQANMAPHTLTLHEGDIPEYRDSLKAALTELKNKLASHPNEAFAERSLEALQSLEQTYRI
ncbi:kinase [Bacillaceae bacterium SIJ1]|uniref:kinase-associated lipoprotein B n=1 Tax=Litoribacterium kuwaitense TaxID=1398745 RepID=UPI0013EE2FD3|nr:kinase-associated lipoprotein B [Litoribacterium kuwaitense]NGP46620.1 kinase [Litoribacterium kuwaitense]